MGLLIFAACTPSIIIENCNRSWLPCGDLLLCAMAHSIAPSACENCPDAPHSLTTCCCIQPTVFTATPVAGGWDLHARRPWGPCSLTRTTARRLEHSMQCPVPVQQPTPLTREAFVVTAAQRISVHTRQVVYEGLQGKEYSRWYGCPPQGKLTATDIMLGGRCRERAGQGWHGVAGRPSPARATRGLAQGVRGVVPKSL